MFANDTNLFLSDVDVDDLFSDMSCELNEISLWFKANKLSLNLTKTKYSFFTQPQNKIKNVFKRTTTLLEMDNIVIER